MSHWAFHCASFTISGRREINQDHCLCMDFNGDRKGNIHAVLAVADGLGGEAGGDVASKLAVENLQSYIEKNPFLPLEVWRQSIRHLYHKINDQIFLTGQSTSDLEGMGTTFVSAFVVEECLVAANVGDSRLYQIREKEVVQISKDHNMLAKMMAKKKYPMKYLKKKEDVLSSSLLRSLGNPEPPKVDFFPEKNKAYPLQEGDIYLLCSDGLTGSCFYPYVSPEDMVEIFSSYSNLNQACEALGNLAYQKGSEDNITLVAMKISQKRRIITGSLRLPKKDL